MAAPVNHTKLGLFVVVGLAAAVLAGSLLGAASFRKTTIRYHSYFNESVEGLNLGSPVKFRGVTIGRVSAIEIAPDHRMVDVVSELDTAEVKRLGLSEAGTEHGAVKFAIPPEMRVQLGSQGITAVKFIAIDFFDEKSNPPPTLPFAVPSDHYIPAVPSMFKNLEDSITTAMDRLPVMVDAVVMIMARVDRLLATLETQDVSGKLVSTLDHANAMMKNSSRMLARLDQQDLGAKAARTINDVNAAVNKVSAALDRIGGQQGLLASAQRATDAFGAVGRAGQGTQKDLEATLRDLSEAAEAFRSLVEALERDPDMLLKGRAKGKVAP
jgi:paraquat-inducible protein B